MRGTRLLLIFAILGVLGAGTLIKRSYAETKASIALTGQVTSAEEGAMEGVLVSAKKAGSTMTTMRRAFVDNSTTPVTFWVGNTHGASIVRLETLN